MSKFDGTAENYRKYRPGIPAEVADLLVAATPQRSPRRLLDVGTGTGLVVKALINEFDDVVAFDTDTGMLQEAEDCLRPLVRVGSSLMLERGSAETFLPHADWRADLVTICRAFHWLDQEAVLKRLDAQVSVDGVVAIFGDNSFWASSNPWKDLVRDLIKSYLGEERRAGDSVFKHHNRPYSEIMAESPFSVVTEHVVPVERIWTANGILGYLYSTSFATPRLFGDRLAEFDAAARDLLASLSADDRFVEANEFLIRIGKRPQLLV